VEKLDVRRAIRDDAGAIAEVHVLGWKWAYRGAMPDAFLDALSPEQREEGWQRTLDRPDRPVFVAERGGKVVGFVASGPAEEDSVDLSRGQVFALYLDPAVVGTGVGRALLSRAVEDLRQRGYGQAVLWVLGTNDRARRFYEAAGWRADGEQRTETWAGLSLDEVRYGIDLR
jgi:ribosomal protein S18 acetylase RimI-like enzyme